MQMIKIRYQKIDGAHFFTSTDELGLGLCAAHNDYDSALNEAFAQLTSLLKIKYNVDTQEWRVL